MGKIIQAKVSVLGNGITGQTQLVACMVGSQFNKRHKPTIGVDFAIKEFTNSNGDTFKLQFWDISREGSPVSLLKSSLNHSSVLLLTFAVNDRQSFDNLTDIINTVDENTTTPISSNNCILVACKSDLQIRRVITFKEAQDFAEKYGFRYIETSASENTNIAELINLTQERAIAVYNLENPQIISFPQPVMSVDQNKQADPLFNQRFSDEYRAHRKDTFLVSPFSIMFWKNVLKLPVTKQEAEEHAAKDPTSRTAAVLKAL